MFILSRRKKFLMNRETNSREHRQEDEKINISVQYCKPSVELLRRFDESINFYFPNFPFQQTICYFLLDEGNL